MFSVFEDPIYILRKFSRHYKMVPDVVWTCEVRRFVSRKAPYRGLCVMQLLWGRKNWKWKTFYLTWMRMPRMDHHFTKKQIFFSCDSPKLFHCSCDSFCLAYRQLHKPVMLKIISWNFFGQKKIYVKKNNNKRNFLIIFYSIG